MTERTAGGRMRCRNCGALAGFSSNVCNGCHYLEVQRHLADKAKAVVAESQVVQASHAAALVTQPRLASLPKRKPSPVPARVLPAPRAGQALLALEGATLVGAATVCCPGQLVAGLSWVQAHQGPAIYQQLFRFRKQRADKRVRMGRTYEHASAPPNVALAKALRLVRMWHLTEAKDLAGAIGCGQSTISNIETPRSVLALIWVERYATAFGVPEHAIWAVAEAMQEDDAKVVGTMAIMRRFVQATDTPPPPAHWEE